MAPFNHLAALRADIEQMDEPERTPALAHLAAAESHLEAVGRWVTHREDRRAREEAAARDRLAEAERQRLAAQHEDG